VFTSRETVDGARANRRAIARIGSPIASPRLISSRCASESRSAPGDQTIPFSSRLPRQRTTDFTVEREHPTSATISRIVLPSPRSDRTRWRCWGVRCGAKETSRSSQLTVVDSPSCCADPLSPPGHYSGVADRQEPCSPADQVCSSDWAASSGSRRADRIHATIPLTHFCRRAPRRRA